MLTKEAKNSVITKLAKSANDTGSCEVQVGLLTQRISQLSEHMKKFPKDTHSQRGLINLIEQRRSFIKYLKKNDPASYDNLVTTLKDL